MSEWLPIESAPRDGTAFLGYCPTRGGYVADQRYIVVYWSGWGGGTWSPTIGRSHFAESEITHWQPLPPPPREG